MTTGPETIAKAIIDAAHILARALESSEWREDARSGPDAPGPVQVDPQGVEGAQSDDCTCFVTPEHTWFRYGSAVEPGSQMEPNPDCPYHFPGCAR